MGAGGKYLYLNPAKATRFLISGSIHGKPFIESKHAKVERRRYIFLFIILQKFLQTVAFPMAHAGDILEFSLNLLALNGGFFSLFLNIILWKLEIPEKGSANYLSAIGFFDRRTELDKSIKPGDNKYFAYLSLMASKIAYENQAFIRVVVQDQWKMEFLGPRYDFWNAYQKKYSTQAIIIHDKHSNPDTIIVAFRGTEPFSADDWMTDLDLSRYKVESMGQVHIGFMRALGLREDGTLPRVGDDKFGRFVDDNLVKEYGVKYYRFVYNHDMVPRVPFDNPCFKFRHCGKCIYYNIMYEGRIMKEEPYKNYFTMRAFLIREFDTLWELLRSFVIRHMHGAEYEEDVMSWLFRLSGVLFCPGIPAHFVRDYVNSIRLGTDNFFD